MDSFETLLYEEDDGVAIVTLNRPEVHNAFNQQMQSRAPAAVDGRCACTTTSGSSS